MTYRYDDARTSAQTSGESVMGRKGTPFPQPPIYGSMRSPTSDC